MKTEVTRREFLRGLGVVLALPALDAFGAPNAAPRRMVAINIPLGFHPPNFFPEQAGRDYTLSPYLRMAEALRNDMTVISGTSHPECDGGHDTEKTWLTAAPHPGARSFKNTISLDQKVATEIGKQTRFASLSLGDHSLAWSANGVSIPMHVRRRLRPRLPRQTLKYSRSVKLTNNSTSFLKRMARFCASTTQAASTVRYAPLTTAPSR